MIILLFKASLVAVILLAFYKFFLEKETFFSANRIYLLSCLALSFSLPFIVLPEVIQNQGVVTSWIETLSQSSDIVTLNNSDIYKENLPTKNIQNNATSILGSKDHKKMSYSDQIQPHSEEEQASTLTKESESVKGIGFWIIAIYLFGVVVLSLSLIGQVINMLWKVIRTKDRIVSDEGVIVNMKSEIEPCSFFKYIFINPSSYDYETYEQILAHEKIHVSKMHSMDLLISELAVIFLWFNPFVWILRKEVEKNIEYQTDDILVANKTVAKQEYQLNLVKIACYQKPLSITTNYNQSLIKQRIMKMNNKKSNRFGLWKYTFLAPTIFVVLLLLNKPLTTFAQEESLSSISSEFTTEEQSENVNISNGKTQVEDVIMGAPYPLDGNEMDIDIPYDPECNLLLKAIRSEDIGEIKRLIKKNNANCKVSNPGYEVLVENADGKHYQRSHARTPLSAAARVGNLEIAKLLIQEGTKIDHHGKDTTSLSEAAHEGHLDFVIYLLDEGADVNSKSGPYGSALGGAAHGGHNDIINLLIGKGANVNMKGGAYGTALSSAANAGHTESISLMLSKGADIDANSGAYGTALNTAANNGHAKAIELLLKKGADIDAKGGAYGSALNTAANNGHMKAIETLLDKGANVDVKGGSYGTALNTSANNGHVKVIELLLKKGADINASGGAYGTALSTAANNGHTHVINLLLEKGADADAPGAVYGTPLNTAANNGHVDVIKLLLDKGANINAAGGSYGTAIGTAANNGHNAVVELLIDKGTNVNGSGGAYGTALNTAANNGHISTIKCY